MVIELSEVQFGLNHTRGFKSNERAARGRFEIASVISDQNFTTFNCRFVKAA